MTDRIANMYSYLAICNKWLPDNVRVDHNIVTIMDIATKVAHVHHNVAGLTASYNVVHAQCNKVAS
jgi:hypothetical protein